MPMGAEISFVLFIDLNYRRSLFWHVLAQRRFRAQSFFMTFCLHVMAKDASGGLSPMAHPLPRGWNDAHRTLLATNETIHHAKELFIGKAIVCMEIEEEKSMAPHGFPSRFWDFVGASTTTLYVCSEWTPLGQEMRSRKHAACPRNISFHRLWLEHSVYKSRLLATKHSCFMTYPALNLSFIDETRIGAKTEDLCWKKSRLSAFICRFMVADLFEVVGEAESLSCNMHLTKDKQQTDWIADDGFSIDTLHTLDWSKAWHAWLVDQYVIRLIVDENCCQGPPCRLFLCEG